MINDAIKTVDFALQSYVDICKEDAEISGEDDLKEKIKTERKELKLAWSTIKSHLNMPFYCPSVASIVLC